MTSVVYGFIEDIKTVLTKKGDKMAFVRLSDYTGMLEVVLFPKTYEEYRTVIAPGLCIGVKGKISSRNGEVSVIADNIKIL
jgi:DNA polymerase-3 subunit alpha